MSLHIFGNVTTPFGTAANNRAENQGNMTTLQKVIWQGQAHTTVSAEAIRFALRRLLAAGDAARTNRQWDETVHNNVWKDRQFKGWATDEGETYIDDDLLGFMSAEAAEEEGQSGSLNARRAVLEVTRAISLTPWPGDVIFSAATGGALPARQRKGRFPSLYGTEVHATRYQYGFALTPERLREKSRAARALTALGSLSTVAGNHGRFLFDFSPDSIVLRVTDDPAPRLLYCFESGDEGKSVTAPGLLRRIDGGDIAAGELVIGGAFAADPAARELKARGAAVFPDGVKRAIAEVVERIGRALGVGGRP